MSEKGPWPLPKLPETPGASLDVARGQSVLQIPVLPNGFRKEEASRINARPCVKPKPNKPRASSSGLTRRKPTTRSLDRCKTKRSDPQAGESRPSRITNPNLMGEAGLTKMASPTQPTFWLFNQTKTLLISKPVLQTGISQALV